MFTLQIYKVLYIYSSLVCENYSLHLKSAPLRKKKKKIQKSPLVVEEDIFSLLEKNIYFCVCVFCCPVLFSISTLSHIQSSHSETHTNASHSYHKNH